MNLGGFMKSVLVKRLESSFYAFNMTLSRFIKSYEQFIEMCKTGDVYISKEINVYDLLDSGDDEKLIHLVEENRVLHFKTNHFNDMFLSDLQSDLSKLRYLHSQWSSITTDPKLEEFLKELKSNPLIKGSKAIIFTESKETAGYLGSKLIKQYGDRVVVFSGESSNVLKHEIELSFNPAYASEQKDKYDILITTDVLAEGVNLHRSNVLINYNLLLIIGKFGITL